MSKEIFKDECIFTQHDVENEQLKEENEKLRNEEKENEKENENGNEKLRKEKNEKLRKEEEKQLKEENGKLRKENEHLGKINVVKYAEIKKSIGKPKEIKSPKENKNTRDSYLNWFDKNKFKNIFSHD